MRSATGTTDRRERPRLPDLRDYQTAGGAAAVSALRTGGRGQYLSACGTGKTLVAVHAAVELVQDGPVVIACPSLGLIAQTLAVWAHTGAAQDLLAVCSDATVRDAAVRVTAQLACDVTTDTAVIVAFLRRSAPGRRLILTTHVSAHLVGAALAAAGTVSELLVIDEAHETTGRVDTDVAAIHDDDRFPARRRLYMTATPRILGTDRRGRVDDAALLSMDDQKVFGPVLSRYSTARAIADGWLDDYRIVAVGITNREVMQLLHATGREALNDDGLATTRTVVLQLALIRAAAEFGLRRMLVFDTGIEASREFARTLPTTVRAVEAAGGELPPGPLTTGHVDGQQTVAQRRIHLEHLTAPPQDGWTVVSNVRCLSTGVDVPAVDGVAFAGQRRATIEVIQAVGRALRRSVGGSGTATILLPILLPDLVPDGQHRTSDSGTTDADLGAWETVCQILRALRAHDEVLGDELDTRRRSACTGRAELPARVLLRLPDGYATEDLVQHITLRILEGTTSDWLVGYTALHAFHTRHGHVRVPTGHREHDIWLARWIGQQRAAAKAGHLPADRRQLLTNLGLDLDPYETAWQQGLAAATAFHREHGHLNVPTGHHRDGVDLAAWLLRRRGDYQRGTLTPARAAALTAIGMIWKTKATWAEGFAAAQAFHREHGHLRAPNGTIIDGIDVHHWLTMRRVDVREGRLTAANRARLDAMGMIWNLREQQWWEQFAALERFHAREGHLRARTGDRHDGVVLSRFMLKMRKDHDEGRLTADQIAAADALGMNWQITGRRYQPGRPRRAGPVPRQPGRALEHLGPLGTDVRRDVPERLAPPDDRHPPGAPP
ncbi:Helicase associated domain protein [Dactylosporangium vinaceum]|uniref:Helicase associated domain protein n=1 Tax=Dactylosporangium vinaceum TaxID=53362 RepID=A0ABV5M2N8_9ACTN|nr:DEAD/DEAH box helicase [Dactylosporangium vinaceum]UAB96316.1 Helicase associated domain protein [Dactylosporangium vinaceum]